MFKTDNLYLVLSFDYDMNLMVYYLGFMLSTDKLMSKNKQKLII